MVNVSRVISDLNFTFTNVRNNFDKFVHRDFEYGKPYKKLLDLNLIYIYLNSIVLGSS